MEIRLNTLWILGLYTLTYIIHDAFSARTSNWLNHLIKYINDDNKEYQVLLLFERKGSYGDIEPEDMVQKISSNFPALKISFQGLTNKKFQKLNQMASFYDPQTTMIFIIDLSKNRNRISQWNRTIEFVSKFSEPRRRSRCVFILPSEKMAFSYRKFLYQMWSQQFLDIIIVELTEQIRNERRSKETYFLNSAKDFPVIHQFNPFKGTYDRSKYSVKAPWFPKKTSNLYKYEMKVGLYHFPPATYVEKNSRGDIIKKSGRDIRLTEALSKAMNFKIKWISSDEKEPWGISSCSKENNTSFISAAMSNEIQMINVEDARYLSCDDRLHEWTKGTQFFSVVLMVPILSEKFDQVLITWKFFNALALISLFLLIWILCRVFPFERRNWNLPQIVRIILGTATTHEPQKLAERIVFGSILLSCLLHSSFIFIAFTDISLIKEPELQLNTIDDVLSSSLEPTISKTYYLTLHETVEGSIKTLVEKAKQVDYMSQTCLKRLIKVKNEACITRSDVAKWFIEKELDSCGRPVMKVVNEPLKVIPTGFILEARSPFVAQFDEVILRLLQSGVFDTWQGHRFGRFSNKRRDESCSRRGSESIQLRKQVAYVILIGYFCATLVFICEVLFAYLTKKVSYLKSH